MPPVIAIFLSIHTPLPVLLQVTVAPDAKKTTLMGTFGDNAEFGLDMNMVHSTRHGDGAHTVIFQTDAFDSGKLARNPSYNLKLPAPFDKVLVFGAAVMVNVNPSGGLRNFTQDHLTQLMAHDAEAGTRPTPAPKAAAVPPPSVDSVLHDLQRETAAAGANLDSRDDIVYSIDDVDGLVSSSEDEVEDTHYVEDEDDEFGEDDEDEHNEGDTRTEFMTQRGSKKRGSGRDAIY